MPKAGPHVAGPRYRMWRSRRISNGILAAAAACQIQAARYPWQRPRAGSGGRSPPLARLPEARARIPSSRGRRRSSARPSNATWASTRRRVARGGAGPTGGRAGPGFAVCRGSRDPGRARMAHHLARAPENGACASMSLSLMSPFANACTQRVFKSLVVPRTRTAGLSFPS